MEPKINNFISPMDITSLKNLSEIKDHQVVDIYDNGTISAPYNRSIMASAWRTGRWLGGLSQNREDIPKIKALMQRAMTGYLSGCQEIKPHLEKAINGLEHLKNTYKEQGKSDASNEIDKIVTYVQQNFQKKEDLPLNLTKDKWLQLNQLEASSIEAGDLGAADAYEGVSYYKNRIAQFLVLEKENLSQEDVHFLEEVDHALDNTLKNKPSHLLSSDSYNNKVEILTDKLIKEGIRRGDAFFKARSQVRVEEVFSELDKASPRLQSEIGVIVPMDINWYEEGNVFEGHTYIVGISKEADGSYTAIQANAGTFALGLNEARLNFHLNYNIPISGNFPCVIEFPSLNRREAEEFLSRAFENDALICNEKKDARKEYNRLFDKIISKKNIERIPPRRGQVTGNCGVRNLKELLIYSFQKDKRIELANKFFKYVDGRGSETLPFEEIKPFKEDF